MKDIDFDELDKAVNRFLGEDVAETKQVVTPAAPEKTEDISESIKPIEAKPKQAPRSARELHGASSGVPVSRSTGRFMDIMRPGQVNVPAPTPVVQSPPERTEPKVVVEAKPVKNPADLVENLSGNVHQRRARKTLPKGLNEELEVASNINYEQPVLESVEVAELPKPTLAPDFDALKANQVLPAEDVLAAKLKSQPQMEVEAELDDNKFVEPFLGAPRSQKPDLSDEIITSGTPGLTQIEDDDDILVYGEAHETVRERINRQAIEEVKGDVTLDAPVEESAGKIELGALKNETDTNTDESLEASSSTKEASRDETKKPIISTDEEPEAPLTTPFLPNARVEKRPLGAAITDQNNSIENTQSRLVNGGAPAKKTKKSANSRSAVPILNSDEYSSPIVARPKRKSGWAVVIAILGIIAMGVLGGLLAWYFLLG